jgi:hypothetical protein
MHPTRRRMVGSIVIAIPFSAIMIRGAPVGDNMSVWAMLGATVGIAIIFYLMWPVFELVWKDRDLGALTWSRFAGWTGVGVLATIVIVIGGRWIGRDLDPWLVLAYVMLIAMMAFVGDGRDAPIRMRPQR